MAVSDPIPKRCGDDVDASSTIRAARARSGLSLRKLASLCSTSHSPLAAYESGRVVPSVETLERVLRGAGFSLSVGLTALVEDGESGADARGRELVEVLELAAMFPARHTRKLECPQFGPTPQAAVRIG